MPDERHTIRVDVLAAANILECRDGVLGVVVQIRRFGASSALSNPALVVAHDEIAGVRKLARHLPNTGTPYTVSSRSIGPEPGHHDDCRKVVPLRQALPSAG